VIEVCNFVDDKLQTASPCTYAVDNAYFQLVFGQHSNSTDLPGRVNIASVGGVSVNIWGQSVREINNRSAGQESHYFSLKHQVHYRLDNSPP